MFLIVLSCFYAFSAEVTEDFEAYNIGKTFEMNNAGGGTATVAANPSGGGKVLFLQNSDWNTVPVFHFTLPEGLTTWKFDRLGGGEGRAFGLPTGPAGESAPLPDLPAGGSAPASAPDPATEGPASSDLFANGSALTPSADLSAGGFDPASSDLQDPGRVGEQAEPPPSVPLREE